jgi:hypothetical protein
LPGRYPSGPTCRRRFEEWQLDGTLLEMVRRLSEVGRTFVYIPEPSADIARLAPEPEIRRPPRDGNMRGVFWKSPESWQTPHAARHTQRAPGAPGWLPADPFAEITRQLAEPGLPPPAPVDPAAGMGVGASRRQAGVPGGSADSNRSSRSMQVKNRHGYVIYVIAQSVQKGMFRAWAEILKDDKRVERSGLIGPRFEHAEAAQQFAFDWASQWIDRECLTTATASPASAASGVSEGAQTPEASAMTPVSRPMPAPRPASEPATSATSHSANVQMNAHVNAHTMNAQAIANARRLPSRGYSDDDVADSAGTTSTTDRFPAYPERISHAR